MSERLTDERIDRLLVVWEQLPPDDGEHVANAGEQVQLLNELRERRAADLSAEDLGSLRFIRGLDAMDAYGYAHDDAKRIHRAAAVLDKLIAAAEARR